LLLGNSFKVLYCCIVFVSLSGSLGLATSSSNQELAPAVKKQRNNPLLSLFTCLGIMIPHMDPSKFEYGSGDFLKVSRGFYLDKTSFIIQLERLPRTVILLRPRRFGKTLFLTMLRYYYDILEGDYYQELFAHLAVFKHVPYDPIYNHSSWLVLSLNFS
jgi:hypothetical protein